MRCTLRHPRSLLSRLKIPGIIGGIVALEWGLAFLVMPGSAPAPPVSAAAVIDSEPLEEVDEQAEIHTGKTDPADSAHGTEKAAHSEGHGPAKGGPRHSDAEEVDLGDFTVSGFQPASNSTLFITFHLYGTVRHKYAREFSQRLEENQHRIRDNIIVIIRSAEITDLGCMTWFVRFWHAGCEIR